MCLVTSNCSPMGQPSKHPGEPSREGPCTCRHPDHQANSGQCRGELFAHKGHGSFHFPVWEIAKGKRELNRLCWKPKGSLNVIITRSNVGEVDRGTTALLVLSHLVLYNDIYQKLWDEFAYPSTQGEPANAFYNHRSGLSQGPELR